MTVSELAVIILLGLSLAANVIYSVSVRWLGRYTNRWDLFGWISAYRLFSRTPRNFQLFYRDKLKDNETTEWTEVPLDSERRWYHPLLFPERMVTENIYSYVDDLVIFAEEGYDSQSISKTFRFKTVMRYLLRFPVIGSPTSRQIKIVETGGHLSYDNNREVFISEFESECISN